MSFLDVLRKLGIVRYGAKAATYNSEKDMPVEFLLDDVYNAKRDLTSQEDVAQVAGALKGAGGRKVLFWVTVGLAALAVLFMTIAGGVSFWLLVGLGLWAGILFLEYQFAYGGRFSYGGMIALVLFGLVVSFFLLGATVSA